MSGQGATSWILDLRGNPGGLLEQAVQLADLFVDTGTVVTTVSGRDREARRAERGFGDTTSSLAVLVNGGSASASEIVAGALKNLDRAVDHRHAHVRQGLGPGALRQRRPLASSS